MKQEIIKKVKVFLWGLLGAGILATLTFVGGNLDLVQQLLERLNLSPELTVIVIAIATNILAQTTKYINQRFSLEEAIGKLGRKLAGKK